MDTAHVRDVDPAVGDLDSPAAGPASGDDEREAVELVTTPNTDRAMTVLADREFDCMVVGRRRTASSEGNFARAVNTKYPDVTLVRYTWEPRPDDTDEVFDAVFEKQVKGAKTVQFLDRVRWLDD